MMNENKQRVTSSTGQAPLNTGTWVRVLRAHLKQTQIYYSVGLHLELEMRSWCPPSSAAQESFSDVIKSDADLLPSTVNINSKHTKSCLLFSMIHINRKLLQTCNFFSELLLNSASWQPPDFCAAVMGDGHIRCAYRSPPCRGVCSDVRTELTASGGQRSQSEIKWQETWADIIAMRETSVISERIH